MARLFSPESFCEGAREFAQSSLDAHRARKFRRVAVDAATCLEQLAKACLASRSPALLTELRGEANFASLLRLLGITEGKAPRQLRTVGLRDALARARVFVQSHASDADLETLVALRDGSVHAAGNDEVEEKLVVAFVQQADAFLADLGRDRAVFWGGRLEMVEALLADATDKTAREVAVRIAWAHAEFGRRYDGGPAEVLQLMRQLAAGTRLDNEEQRGDCPACGSAAVVYGDPEVDWDYEKDEHGRHRATRGKVWFNAYGLECSVCGLDLDDDAKLAAAGLRTRWLLPGADPNVYDPGFDEELYYEGLQEERRFREEREDDEAAAAGFHE